jgi:hypothetical protein
MGMNQGHGHDAPSGWSHFQTNREVGVERGATTRGLSGSCTLGTMGR